MHLRNVAVRRWRGENDSRMLALDVVEVRYEVHPGVAHVV